MEHKPVGRGRSRARASSQQQQTEQVRRPGGPAGQPVQQQAPPPPQTQTVPSGAGGGRKTHRGVSRSDARPGDAVADVTRALASADISSDSAGRGAKRRGREDYEYASDNTRPAHIEDKKGVSGQVCTIVANYFELLSKPQWCVYQYHVDFAPVVESSRMRRSLLGPHRPAFGNCYLFDGMSDLKLVIKLEQDVTELYSQRKTDDENIRITVKRTGELAPNHPELGRLYNTQMRRNLNYLKFQLLGRHYFDPEAVSEIPEYSLQVWSGVITSIRQQEEKLMMSVDTVHKVIRGETCYNVLKEMASYCGPNFRDECSKELVGAIVMTKYNNKTYRIEDIDWNGKPVDTFEDSRAKEQINFVQYYKRQYDIQIQDEQQPLLIVTSKEKEIRRGESQNKVIKLIPELSYLTGISEKMRANYKFMKTLADTTKLSPEVRVRNLLTFIQRLGKNENVIQDMSNWGLKFADKLVTFQGRILSGETVMQGNKKIIEGKQSDDFSREMRGVSLHVPRDLHNWVVICLMKDKAICNDFLTTLARVCPPMGCRVSPCNPIYIAQDRVNNYLQAFRENVTAQTTLVVFIVPNNKKDRYDALKKHCCLDFPIPSQVIVSRTLSKKPMLMSVCTKVAIQLVTKLGGEPWSLVIPLKMGIMIIGYDTYHDSSKRGRSAGAFVASLNNSCTRYYSKVNFHSAGGWQELSDHLKISFTEALKKYQEVNRALPELIIFYRDGVGDGQIRYVKEWEVAQFVSVIDEQLEQRGAGDGNRKTRFAFIVVNKRINTRFFELRNNRYINPPPGTIVDSTVTRYDRYDFFLVSQSAKQGTVAPTMFNIIVDTTTLKPEHFQKLSYKMTHLYFNYPGTIRVPAPCQYAHKLAFLAGQSLHKEPREELCDTLFYL